VGDLAVNMTLDLTMTMIPTDLETVQVEIERKDMTAKTKGSRPGLAEAQVEFGRQFHKQRLSQIATFKRHPIHLISPAKLVQAKILT
jgi:hypothetical protein